MNFPSKALACQDMQQGEYHMTFRTLLGSAALSLAVALPALADENPAIEQRQGQFKLYVHNFGLLGGMAQGRMDYDADMAQTAADNLFHLTRHDQSRLWPEGTDSMSVDGTRANPAIWDDLDDFVMKFSALQDAAENLQSVAGDGLDAMRAGFGPVGQACQACHEAYRDEAS
ncbi:cytochrome C554 [Roseinatronobacter bogoriensis subsp. barguzinensis]|uniref:Cytochrome C554 n=2 Tax=Roseinatronobacter bogoriensis TaxID=119542 RepID=A0A2K8KBB6_9RHOB|nr:cytochrome C554 [Rhodobaca barguzinensis]